MLSLVLTPQVSLLRFNGSRSSCCRVLFMHLVWGYHCIHAPCLCGTADPWEPKHIHRTWPQASGPPCGALACKHKITVWGIAFSQECLI